MNELINRERERVSLTKERRFTQVNLLSASDSREEEVAG